jgi:gluconolactonase
MKHRLLTLVSVLTLLFALGSSTVLAAPPLQEETTYIVQAGDSLWELAEVYLGNGALYIAIVSATNERHQTDPSYANIAEPTAIRAGWKLLIPGVAPRAEPAAPVPTPGPDQTAGQSDIVLDGLLFPQGAFWSPRDGTLYFVEWGSDTVWSLKDGEAEVALELEPGDGPSGLFQDAGGDLWLALYSSRQVVQLSPNGEVLQTFDGYQGRRFRRPNDLVVDARGGVYFTESGDLDGEPSAAGAAGAVYYITPESELVQVDSELAYPNGIAITPDGRSLVVDEGRRNRVLKYAIHADGTLSDPDVLLELDDEYRGDAGYRYELGPDGVWCDGRGNLWVAHYGGGKVLVISPGGVPLKKILLPRGMYPTSVALSPDADVLYVTEGGEGLLYRIRVE